MILIGDKLVPFDEITPIVHVAQIENTKANTCISFGYNEEILIYTSKNEIETAVEVSNIKEAIYSNALNAKYILANKTLAKELQKIAENYMFDSKILAIIESSDEIEEIALNEIDGVIYKNLLD